MSRRWLRALAAALGLALAGAALYFVLFLRPLTVEVARPAAQVPVEVFGLGTVEARILSRIGFEVGAALVELNVDHGDLVREGDVLARLHGDEQEARVAQSRAGVRHAQASVRVAEASVAKAAAVLAQKQESNRRKQTLLARRTVSVEVAEEAQLEVDVAEAELAVATSDLEVARAALADAEARQAYEEVLLDHHQLRAPYDALVVERHKELGSVLGAGEPLFTLVAPETVWVLAYVDESRAGGIRLGQPAEVRLRSLPRESFQGHVVRIAVESDRVSEERRVFVACDRCPQSFHLGEQAEVLITTGLLEDALLVPQAAVEAFDGRHGTVWTVEQGELRRRRVAFGQATLDSRLEVAGGLPEGARVVTALRAGLREGRAARAAGAGAP